MTCQNARLRPSSQEEGTVKRTIHTRPAFFFFPLHFIQPLHRQPNSAGIAQVSTPHFNARPDLPTNALHQALLLLDPDPQYSPAAMPIPIHALLLRFLPTILVPA